jgi:hypothetical protein
MAMLWACSVLVGCASSYEIRPVVRDSPDASHVEHNAPRSVVQDVHDHDFERADAVINPALVGEQVQEDQARTSKEAPHSPEPRDLRLLPTSVSSPKRSHSRTM